MTAVPFSEDSTDVAAIEQQPGSGASWVEIAMIVAGALLVLGAIVAAVLL